MSEASSISWSDLWNPIIPLYEPNESKTERRSRDIIRTTGLPDELIDGALQYFQRMDMILNESKSISLGMPKESTKDGNGSSETSADTQVPYEEYIRTYGDLLREERKKASVCIKIVWDLEAKCTDVSKLVDHVKKACFGMFKNEDYIKELTKNEHKNVTRALKNADVKLSEAERTYIKAEERFYAALWCLSGTWIERVTAPEHGFQYDWKIPEIHLKRYRTDMENICDRLRGMKAAATKDTLTRQRDLESYDRSCGNTAALVVNTAPSVVVIPPSGL